MMLTGNDGILRKAGEAKTKTTEAEIEEEIKLAYIEVQTNSYVQGWDITKKGEELEKKLQNEDIFATVEVDGTNLNVSYKDYETIINENEEVAKIQKSKIIINEFKISGTKVNTVPVPDGFVYVGGTIDEGYVISDNQLDKDKGVDSELVGNQFVWVPVDQDQRITIKITSEVDITSLTLIDPLDEEILVESNVGKSYNNTNIMPTINGPYKLVIKTNEKEKDRNLNVHSLYADDTFWDFKEEELNGQAKQMGFENFTQYIEEWAKMIVGEDVTEEQLENAKVELTAIMGVYPKGIFEETENYTQKVNENGGFYIGRYEVGDLSAIEERTKESGITGEIAIQKDKYVYNWISQEQALEKAKAYNTNVTSTLVTGAAWDRTLGWLYQTAEKKGEEIALDSSSWGNYINDTFSNTKGIIKTGIYEQTRANNIYDLAGNLMEWTTQVTKSKSLINRGGSYNNGHAADFRGSTDKTKSLEYLGFRLALFL